MPLQLYSARSECDCLNIPTEKLILRGTLHVYRYIMCNSFSAKIRKDTATSRIIEEFEWSDKKYLLLSDFCYLHNHSATLICELREPNSEKKGRIIPSLSELKNKSGRFISEHHPGVKESSNLYSLMKTLSDFDRSSMKEGNIIALTPPEKFIAQAPIHQYGFKKITKH